MVRPNWTTHSKTVYRAEEMDIERTELHISRDNTIAHSYYLSYQRFRFSP